jgi:hypothetical protein
MPRPALSQHIEDERELFYAKRVGAYQRVLLLVEQLGQEEGAKEARRAGEQHSLGWRWGGRES